MIGLLLWLGHAAADFKLVSLQSYPQALCLDGSPATLYVLEGAQKDKIILHFRGGGWCMGNNSNQTLQNCLARSKTALGSSKFLTPTADLSIYGYFSQDSVSNPDFHNWTKILINYCTGTGHQGYIKDPVNVNGQNLYFKGHPVTLAAFSYIEMHYKAFSDSSKTFCLSGDSAGGLATYMWTDYVHDLVKGKYLAIPDSGIFNDQKSVSGNFTYRQSIISLTNLVNNQVNLPNKACQQVYSQKEDRYKCMMVDYLHPFIKSDFIILQSLYDSWVAPNILGLSCVSRGIDTCKQANEMAILQDHRQATLKLIKFITTSGSKRSAFAIACSHHDMTVGTFNNPNYKVSGWTVQQAISFYLAGGKVGFYDESSWPSNAPCAHLHEIQ